MKETCAKCGVVQESSKFPPSGQLCWPCRKEAKRKYNEQCGEKKIVNDIEYRSMVLVQNRKDRRDFDRGEEEDFGW